jgi:hypothetical protein
VLRTATEPMTAKEIASGVLAAANITDAYQAQRRCTECRRSAWGRKAAKFGHLGWPACMNIAKCLQLVRIAESFAAQASIMGSNFAAANSDSSADPFAILDLPGAPNRIWEWRSPRDREDIQ